jgi:thioredoxin 1
VADSAPESVLFVKVDVDDSPELARQWDVQGIPVMIRIKDGQEEARLVGYRSQEQIEQFAYPPATP